MAYTILRTKKGDQVAFRGQCKHHPKEPVGVCSAQLSSSGSANIEDAKREISLYFKDDEIINYSRSIDNWIE